MKIMSEKYLFALFFLILHLSFQKPVKSKLRQVELQKNVTQAQVVLSSNQSVIKYQPGDNLTIEENITSLDINSTSFLKRKKLNVTKDLEIGILPLILQSALGFYLIFCSLSFLKLYEEIDIMKRTHLQLRYKSFKDLSKASPDELVNLNGKFVFASGRMTYVQYAKDDIFSHIPQVYLKIQRNVEYYDDKNDKWRLDSECSAETCKYQPNLISKVFHGKGSLYDIQLNALQIDTFEKSEIIDWPREMTDFPLLKAYFPIAENVVFEKSYLYITAHFAANTENLKMRVQITGYRGEYASIFARVNLGCFSTVHLPYKVGEDVDSNDPNNLNKTNEIVVLTADLDPINVLYCFCLTPLPTMHQPQDKNCINWVKDKPVTKDEFLYEKHNISLINLYSTRFLCTVVVYLLFLLFPYTLYLVYGFFGFSRTAVRKHFYILDLEITFILIFLIIIYSKASWGMKGFCSMCLSCTVITVLCIYLFKAILSLL